MVFRIIFRIFYFGNYFGWYFWCILDFRTGDQKKNIRQGPWDPLELLCTEFICYYLLVSRNIWSCILFLGVEHTVELVQLVFDFPTEVLLWYISL